MKKLFKVVALLLVSAIAAVALAGCNPNSADESIVGYWQHENDAGFDFKADGTVDSYFKDPSGSSGWYYQSLGAYTFSSGTLTIQGISTSCTISGNSLTMDAGSGVATYIKTTTLPQGATPAPATPSN